MENAHRKRLVGAIVLLALGLIIIPTVLDFSQDLPDQDIRNEIPEAPDTMKMEVLPLDVWSEPVDPEIDTDNRVVETPAPVEEQQQADEQQAEPAVVADEPKPAPVPEQSSEKNEDAPTTPVSGISGWAVQVASFSEQAKAFALRDRLRAAGHTAFVEKFRAGSGLTYRVKAGPVLQRSEADKLKKQIADETGLDGLVTKYQ